MNRKTLLCIIVGLLALFLGCAGQVKKREEVPPAVVLRIDDREARGTNELGVAPDWERMQKETGQEDTPPDLALLTVKGQMLELWGSGALINPFDLFKRWQELGVDRQQAETNSRSYSFRLRYEQVFDPGRQRVNLFFLPENKEPALFVHIDTAGNDPIRREILPGFTLEQKLVPNASPAVRGASAIRYWLPVEVISSEGSRTLVGGQTGVVSHNDTNYQLHIYRSIQRSPGTDPNIAFEGERFLLSVTIILK